MINRRDLLAGLAAIAGAALLHEPASASAYGLLDHLRREYEWAANGLLDAVEANDFTAWEPGEATEKPCRWRLARAYVTARELEPADAYTAALSEAFHGLWEQLNRPKPAYAPA